MLSQLLLEAADLLLAWPVPLRQRLHSALISVLAELS